MSNTKHIAIVGGGLVGSLLSIYLRKRGHRVTVFERRPDARKAHVYAGRSINLALSTRGIKALEEIGVADIIKQVAIPMHGRVMHDIKGNLTSQPYGKEGQYINSVSRGDLNVVLMNEAEKHGVEFLFEHRCVHIDLEKTEISWTTSALNPALPAQLPMDIASARYDVIIGADGAFSAVRAAMQYTDRFDFSQDYIDHGYKELHIPAGAAGAFQLERNALHIWPRESFMMIALPNPDGSFTCTLFFPFEGAHSFASLNTPAKTDRFFRETFPDAYRLMPTLLEDFNTNPTGSLVTIKCFPWVKNNTLLIGDAAHAIVPFYGQGMNAGFEDCRILNRLLEKYDDHWATVFADFQSLRKPDADAVAQLALDNFIEMRDLVADEHFLIRKKIEAKLHMLYPDRWIPLYTMVTFRDDIRYANAYAMGQKQKQIMDEVMQQPDILARWQDLDFNHIIKRLPE